MSNNDTVHYKVDKNFFKDIFEKERMKMSKKVGTELSQAKFTKLLGINRVQFKFPKNLNVNLLPKKKVRRVIARRRR